MANGSSHRQRVPRVFALRLTIDSTSGSPARKALAKALTNERFCILKKQRNAPTSLTLHEQFYAKRSEAHATNVQLFTFPWGIPRGVASPKARTPAWSIPPSGGMITGHTPCLQVLTPGYPCCLIPLDSPPSPRYDLSGLLFGADLGFHAEWLRDEPYDATATGLGSYILTAGANSHPEDGGT